MLSLQLGRLPLELLLQFGLMHGLLMLQLSLVLGHLRSTFCRVAFDLL